MENRSPLPGASIPIVPLSQPCPVSFYFFRTEICEGSLIFSAGDVNSRGPQLSYDWLLCKHPRKTPWEVLLKIKRYGTGLTQRVSMEDGSSG